MTKNKPINVINIKNKCSRNALFVWVVCVHILNNLSVVRCVLSSLSIMHIFKNAHSHVKLVLLVYLTNYWLVFIFTFIAVAVCVFLVNVQKIFFGCEYWLHSLLLYVNETASDYINNQICPTESKSRHFPTPFPRCRHFNSDCDYDCARHFFAAALLSSNPRLDRIIS